MPYWDWASSPAIPNIVNTPSITITTPSGPRTVNNPLYRYTLPTLDPTYFPRNAPDGFLARDKTTIRDSNANAALARAGLTGATVRISDCTLHLDSTDSIFSITFSPVLLITVPSPPRLFQGVHLKRCTALYMYLWVEITGICHSFPMLLLIQSCEFPFDVYLASYLPIIYHEWVLT